MLTACFFTPSRPLEQRRDVTLVCLCNPCLLSYVLLVDRGRGGGLSCLVSSLMFFVSLRGGGMGRGEGNMACARQGFFCAFFSFSIRLCFRDAHSNELSDRSAFRSRQGVWGGEGRVGGRQFDEEWGREGGVGVRLRGGGGCPPVLLLPVSSQTHTPHPTFPARQRFRVCSAFPFPLIQSKTALPRLSLFILLVASVAVAPLAQCLEKGLGLRDTRILRGKLRQLCDKISARCENASLRGCRVGLASNQQAERRHDANAPVVGSPLQEGQGGEDELTGAVQGQPRQLDQLAHDAARPEAGVHVHKGRQVFLRRPHVVSYQVRQEVHGDRCVALHKGRQPVRRHADAQQSSLVLRELLLQSLLFLGRKVLLERLLHGVTQLQGVVRGAGHGGVPDEVRRVTLRVKPAQLLLADTQGRGRRALAERLEAGLQGLAAVGPLTLNRACVHVVVVGRHEHGCDAVPGQCAGRALLGRLLRGLERLDERRVALQHIVACDDGRRVFLQNLPRCAGKQFLPLRQALQDEHFQAELLVDPLLVVGRLFYAQVSLNQLEDAVERAFCVRRRFSISLRLRRNGVEDEGCD
eukprot:Rhum_TRINITY_DN16796_c0_g1::Rhum_TRINITY_DN16796_c0_g1_i1::g.164432::m.164432